MSRLKKPDLSVLNQDVSQLELFTICRAFALVDQIFHASSDQLICIFQFCYCLLPLAFVLFSSLSGLFLTLAQDTRTINDLRRCLDTVYALYRGTSDVWSSQMICGKLLKIEAVPPPTPVICPECQVCPQTSTPQLSPEEEAKRIQEEILRQNALFFAKTAVGADLTAQTATPAGNAETQTSTHQEL
jgi:hypothetical protein